jgi:hypothetical protein
VLEAIPLQRARRGGLLIMGRIFQKKKKVKQKLPSCKKNQIHAKHFEKKKKRRKKKEEKWWVGEEGGGVGVKIKIIE